MMECERGGRGEEEKKVDVKEKEHWEGGAIEKQSECCWPLCLKGFFFLKLLRVDFWIIKNEFHVNKLVKRKGMKCVKQFKVLNHLEYNTKLVLNRGVKCI